MPVNIIVAIKQVMDPEMPPSAFTISENAKEVVSPGNIPPVINGYDEQAIEAALRIKETVGEATITVVSIGSNFSLDVMKKPLSMGADELILVDTGDIGNDPDSNIAACLLTAAIRKIGSFDLILCGRQASDWDNAQVPVGVASMLKIPVITVGRKVDITGENVRVERVLPNGYELVESNLPAVVTLSSELGEPRYPTLRGIMAATKKQPISWSLNDLSIDEGLPSSNLTINTITTPEKQNECTIVEGENGQAAGKNLALRLREAKLI